MIPDDEHGWAVDEVMGIAHRRYAPHARNHPRTRTRTGLARYGDLRACPVCWPPPPKKPTRSRKRCAS